MAESQKDRALNAILGGFLNPTEEKMEEHENAANKREAEQRKADKAKTGAPKPSGTRKSWRDKGRG